MQVTRVEGRVAEILDSRRLVINRGSADGVTSGMRFDIRSKSALEIRDPETNEILDNIDRVKVRVEATEVRQRISICSTYEYRVIGGGGPDYSALTQGKGGGFAPSQRIPITLLAKDSSIPPPLDPEDSYIERGDRAIQIIEPGRP